MKINMLDNKKSGGLREQIEKNELPIIIGNRCDNKVSNKVSLREVEVLTTEVKELDRNRLYTREVGEGRCLKDILLEVKHDSKWAEETASKYKEEWIRCNKVEISDTSCKKLKSENQYLKEIVSILIDKEKKDDKRVGLVLTDIEVKLMLILLAIMSVLVIILAIK